MRWFATYEDDLISMDKEEPITEFEKAILRKLEKIRKVYDWFIYTDLSEEP
jgi:hypothetical protein